MRRNSAILVVNARRFALINKEITQDLTTAEAAELEELSAEIDALVDRVAPLPSLDGQ